MLEKILDALRDEGYDTNVVDNIIHVSVDEFDLYRIFVEKTIFLKSVDTGRCVNFNSFNDFLYFLES